MIARAHWKRDFIVPFFPDFCAFPEKIEKKSVEA
jgi:hypothetical protein